MEDRLLEFLKNQETPRTCTQFKEDMQEYIESTSNSAKFQKKLQYHKALSNKTRLLIYQITQKETTCNCALASILGLTEGSITHHLKVLEKAGLIYGRAKGHFIYFYPNEEYTL